MDEVERDFEEPEENVEEEEDVADTDEP